MVLMEKATTKAFWEQVHLGEEYRVLREKIIAIYTESRMDVIPVMDFKSRMRFYTDGDRTQFENAYFRRRQYLAGAALLALIYPEEPGYLQETEEIIWAICQEYTWALPAHCAGDATDTTVIDLFSAETGFALAEIQYLLADRLDPMILTRIKAEVQRRIVDNYAIGTWWWEKSNANWAAVCAGNIGGALIYLFPELLGAYLPRLTATLQCFLNGFPTDGTCMEGAVYWNYGFGCFACFADLLCQYTDGETDLFARKNVDNIAGYIQRMFIKGNTAISFSDGTPDFKADRGLQAFLQRKFPGKVSAIDPVCCTYYMDRMMWRPAFRNVYCLDGSSSVQKIQPKDYYLPDAGQVVINRDGYSLAAKAGHNNEPHNHNDVGTLILSTEKGQVICDVGAGLYTRDYFRPETRYDHFCTASTGHSVPIIDGNGQMPGKDHKGTLRYADGVIRIDLAGAYGLPALKKLERTIVCGENTVTVTDRFDIPYRTFTERFVSPFLPEIADGCVKLADISLQYDSKICTAQATEALFVAHSGQPMTVYCLDFVLSEGLREISFVIKTEPTEVAAE